MSINSTIEWTEATWNPVTGCSRASAGCDHCYAVKGTYRLGAMAAADRRAGRNPGRKARYEGLTVLNRQGDRHFNGVVNTVPEALAIPLKRKTPTVWFVNSMSDLFHPGVPEAFIRRVFDVMAQTPRHTYQVLTKRPGRAAALTSTLPWPANLWFGASVEDHRVVARIDELQRTDAAIRFLSVEPLIGPLPDLPLDGIHWVITGGESGPGARPMHADWVRRIRDRCVDHGIDHFFKQWGRLANNPDPDDPTAKEHGGTAKGGRMLDGRTWDEMPVAK